MSLDEEQLFLIFEFLSCDLKNYLDKQRRAKKRLDQITVKSYTFQILQVLALRKLNRFVKIFIYRHFRFVIQEEFYIEI